MPGFPVIRLSLGTSQGLVSKTFCIFLDFLDTSGTSRSVLCQSLSSARRLAAEKTPKNRNDKIWIFCQFRFDRFDNLFDSIDYRLSRRGGPPCRRRENVQKRPKAFKEIQKCPKNVQKHPKCPKLFLIFGRSLRTVSPQPQPPPRPSQPENS